MTNLESFLQDTKVRLIKILEDPATDLRDRTVFVLVIEAAVYACGVERLVIAGAFDVERSTVEDWSKKTRAPTQPFLDAEETKKRDVVEKLLWNLSIENGKVAQVRFRSPYDILARAPKNADFRSRLPD